MKNGKMADIILASFHFFRSCLRTGGKAWELRVTESIRGVRANGSTCPDSIAGRNSEIILRLFYGEQECHSD